MRHSAFGENKKSLLDKVIAWVRINRVKKSIGHGGVILDLGCGYRGEMLSNLSLNFEKHGIDLSVSKGSKNLISGRVDSRLPYPDNYFDIVTALAIIEHVDKPQVMLREAYRILKPSGKIIITTPSIYGKSILEFMARVGLISKTEIDDHKRYYDLVSLSDALAHEGFESKNIVVKRFGLGLLNIYGSAIK